jgi:hypothetical protein
MHASVVGNMNQPSSTFSLKTKSDLRRAFLGAVETVRYRGCSDAQEPGPLSWPKNAIPSGICWSARVTQVDYPSWATDFRTDVYSRPAQAVDAGDVFCTFCDPAGNSAAKLGRLAQVILVRSPFGNGKARTDKGMLRDKVASRRDGETLPLQNGAQPGQARSHPDVTADGDRQSPSTWLKGDSTNEGILPAYTGTPTINRSPSIWPEKESLSRAVVTLMGANEGTPVPSAMASTILRVLPVGEK